MTWKKFEKNINIVKKLDIYDPSGFYFGSIGNFSQGDTNEILLLSYNGNLMIYKNSGKIVMKMPFSTEINTIFLDDLYLNGEKIFISMSYSGEIHVFTQLGEEIWKKQCEASIVQGIIGNLDYDPQKEIVALLENNVILILNNKGITIATYKHDTGISNICLGKINSLDKKVIIFQDYNGKINLLDIEKSVSQLAVNIKPILGLASLNVYDSTLIVVYDDKNIIYLVDKKGHQIDSIKNSKPIQSIFTGPLNHKEVDSILVLTEDSHLLTYDVEIKDSSQFISKSPKDVNLLQTKENKENKKIPINNQPAKLEVNSEYFNKFPIKQAIQPEVERTATSRKISETKNYKCPECGDFLPPSLVERILQNKPSFCEECGCELVRKQFEI